MKMRNCFDSLSHWWLYHIVYVSMNSVLRYVKSHVTLHMSHTISSTSTSLSLRVIIKKNYKSNPKVMKPVGLYDSHFDKQRTAVRKI